MEYIIAAVVLAIFFGLLYVCRRVSQLRGAIIILVNKNEQWNEAFGSKLMLKFEQLENDRKHLKIENARLRQMLGRSLDEDEKLFPARQHLGPKMVRRGGNEPPADTPPPLGGRTTHGSDIHGS